MGVWKFPAGVKGASRAGRIGPVRGPVVIAHRAELVACSPPGCPKARYAPGPKPNSSTRADPERDGHPARIRIGQGGCQTIEDAVVLAHQAAPDAGLGAALAAYTRQRLPRTMDVVRRAERIGRLTTWRSRRACALRAALMAANARLAPDLALRTLDGIADRRPPAATYAAGARGTRTAELPEENR